MHCKGSTLAKVVVALTLSSLCGFVDVLCVARYGAFPATQTGNVIFFGEYLHRLFSPALDQAPGEEAVAVEAIYYRLAVMLCSVLGGYAYCAFEHVKPHRTAATIGPVLALMVLSADVIPHLRGEKWKISRDIVSHGGLSGPDSDSKSFQMAGKWCVCILAFAFGGLHFMCSPTSDGSRLKAVTFAATGHMHKLTKLFWQWTHCKPIQPADRASAVVSVSVVLGMILGAVAGALAMHAGADQWLFVPVAIGVLGAVELHDAALKPPPGWGDQGPAKHSRIAPDDKKPSDAARPLLQGEDSGGPRSADGTPNGRVVPVGDPEMGAVAAYQLMPASEK